MKWKHKKDERIIEVVDDERGLRYFVWVDDAEQNICQWDLIYGQPWDEIFEKLK